MMVLFQWCVWLVIAFALAALLRRKPVETAAPAAFAIILLLYLGGLLGDLRIGLGLVWAGALAAAVWLVRLWVKPEGLAGLGGRARVARQWGVSLAAMALLAVWVVCLTAGRRAVVWDDLSHWALAVRNMIALDQHHCVPLSSTTFRGYPPASSLFEYFFARFAGEHWLEAAYFGLDMLMLSCILPAFRCASRKQWWKTLLMGAALMVLPHVFYENAFVSMYVDALLGLVMAWVVFTALRTDRIDTADLVCLCGGAAVLALTKETGMVLVLLAALIIFASRLARSGRPADRAGWIRLLIVPVAILLFALLFRQSWSLYRGMNGVEAAWNVSTPWSDDAIESVSGVSENAFGVIEENDLSQLTAAEMEAMRAARVKYFFNLLFTSKRYYILVGGVCAAYLYWGLRSQQKKQGAVTLAAVLAGFAAYALGLLYLYLYSEFEATPTCPSQERYLFTYLIFAVCSGLMLLANFSLSVPDSRRPKRNLIIPAALAVYVLLAGLMIRKSAMLWVLPPFSMQRTQAVLSDAQATIDAEQWLDEVTLDPAADRIGLLIGDAGQWGWEYDVKALALAFAPTKTWSTTEGWEDPARWEQALENSTYVYVYRLSDALTEQTAHLFAQPAEEATLYRVSDGMLTPVK